MKLLIDMALSPRTVQFLKEQGYDAVRVNEVIPGTGIDDRVIFQFAINNDYSIITADLEFGEILAFTQYNRPSTIILRLEDQRVDNVNRLLAEVLPKVKDAIKEGSIVIIEDKRFRLRPLPLK